MNTPSRGKIILAFAAVYVIWGSTYLAIRFAVETLPPFLMAGIRFIIAGGFLYTFLRLRGAARPTPIHWKSASIVGAALLLIGNGGVSWAEQFVPSGITALLIAIVPLWFVVLDWWQRGVQPTLAVIGGLILGTVGVLVLVDPAELVGGEAVHLGGAFVLLVATISWAAGSLYSRRAELPSSPLLATAMEMLSGGVMLLIVSAASGELVPMEIPSINPRSWIALGYLVVFGSLVAFSAYIWLLSHVQPTMVSTYAYVNPVIAVFLGWLLGGEIIGERILLAAAMIVGAVALITSFSARRSAQRRKADRKSNAS
ncbi:MAG: drug/metabolite exporter YedA [Ignavibacteriales bacterium]|nr:drug/metabolite exporter YedA [Ignavibacteriales bacterium]